MVISHSGSVSNTRSAVPSLPAAARPPSHPSESVVVIPSVRRGAGRAVVGAASSVAVKASERSEAVRGLLADLECCTEAARSEHLRQQVVLLTLPVARSIASRYRNRGVDIGDLEQIAALGLMKAVRRWQPGLSEDFLQYAVPTITGEIKRFFRDRWWTVRPPRRLQEARAALVQAEQVLRQRTGAEPDDAALAVEMGSDVETVREAKQVRQSARPASLEDPASDNGVIDRAVAGEDAALQRAEERIDVQRMLQELPERDRKVIELRFFKNWSQSRIGEQIGVSQMQVSRILRDITRRLHDRWED